MVNLRIPYDAQIRYYRIPDAAKSAAFSKLASDLPACSGEVINTALDWLHDSNAVSRATLLMALAERMENSHPQKQLLARAERILKREIQDCQTASDIPRSIALYSNCVDALYGENAASVPADSTHHRLSQSQPKQGMPC